jgi:hypothetical protein
VLANSPFCGSTWVIILVGALARAAVPIV